MLHARTRNGPLVKALVIGTGCSRGRPPPAMDAASVCKVTIPNMEDASGFRNWKSFTSIGLRVTQNSSHIGGAFAGLNGEITALALGGAKLDGDQVALEPHSGYTNHFGNCARNVVLTMRGALVWSGRAETTYADNGARTAKRWTTACPSDSSM